MQKRRKMVRQIVVSNLIMVLFALLIGNAIGAVIFLKGNRASAEEIMADKERTYKIYNEGIEASENLLYHSYDSVTISSPCVEDRELAYHQGLKYVRHPDLLELETKGLFQTIKYDGTFKFYNGDNKSYYIEILIDREHIDEMDYYDYREVIDKTEIIKDILFLMEKEVCCLLIIGIIVKIISKTIKNCHQKNKENSRSKQEEKDTEGQEEDGNEENQEDEEEDD